MSDNIGMSIDKFNARHSDIELKTIFLSKKKLANGNVENEYKYSGTCHFFYEYNPLTTIIVSWRFTGRKEHCGIAL